jgi:serine/threonine protein kinase
LAEIAAMRRKSSAFCGTAHFVSPEALEAAEWTFASDLFAVGCCVYYMLAGRPLFDGAGPYQVLQQVRAGVKAKESREWSAAVLAVPGAESLIRTLLDPNPFLRFCRPSTTSSATQGSPVMIATDESEHATSYEFDLERFRRHPFFGEAFQSTWDALLADEASVVESGRSADSGSASATGRLRPITYDVEPRHDEAYAAYAAAAAAGEGMGAQLAAAMDAKIGELLRGLKTDD